MIQVDDKGRLLARNGKRLHRASDYRLRIVEYEYDSEETAEGDIAGGEYDIRMERFRQWDRAAALREQFGWGGLARTAKILDKSTETVRVWSLCSYVFPAELRRVEFDKWVYYAALKIELNKGEGVGVEALRQALKDSSRAGEAWAKLKLAANRKKERLARTGDAQIRKSVMGEPHGTYIFLPGTEIDVEASDQTEVVVNRILQ